jgi:arylsulfatase A-like enzyme
MRAQRRHRVVRHLGAGEFLSTSRRRALQYLSAGAAGAVWSRGGTAAPTRPPNIVFILADDLGYADLSCYGRRDYQTPQIDRLAARGLKLTQAYSNSSVCSPTRCALATGRYQYRLEAGLPEPIPAKADDLGLPPGHPTIASLLRQRGYRTALIGKWHLGNEPQNGPRRHGYDHFFGVHGGAADYFTHEFATPAAGNPDLFEDEQRIRRQGYLTELLTAEALTEIERNARKRQPFLLSLHYTAPHWPWEAPGDEAVSRSLSSIFHGDGGSLETYARMVASLDEGVGRVLAQLARHDLERDTLVVFTSDNGGERFSDTWPFTGMKGELLEGGIRVPALVSWPGRIAAGKVSGQVCVTMDWLPTLLALANGAPDAAYPSDGENLLPHLVGEVGERSRTIYWRHKSHDQAALRVGDWKYLRIGGNEFLFDLARDLRERANLKDRERERYERMKADHAAWNQTMLPYAPETNSMSTKSPARAADRY